MIAHMGIEFHWTISMTECDCPSWVLFSLSKSRCVIAESKLVFHYVDMEIEDHVVISRAVQQRIGGMKGVRLLLLTWGTLGRSTSSPTQEYQEFVAFLIGDFAKVVLWCFTYLKEHIC